MFASFENRFGKGVGTVLASIDEVMRRFYLSVSILLVFMQTGMLGCQPMRALSEQQDQNHQSIDEDPFVEKCLEVVNGYCMDHPCGEPVSATLLCEQWPFLHSEYPEVFQNDTEFEEVSERLSLELGLTSGQLVSSGENALPWEEMGGAFQFSAFVAAMTAYLMPNGKKVDVYTSWATDLPWERLLQATRLLLQYSPKEKREVSHEREFVTAFIGVASLSDSPDSPVFDALDKLMALALFRFRALRDLSHLPSDKAILRLASEIKDRDPIHYLSQIVPRWHAITRWKSPIDLDPLAVPIAERVPSDMKDAELILWATHTTIVDTIRTLSLIPEAEVQRLIHSTKQLRRSTEAFEEAVKLAELDIESPENTRARAALSLNFLGGAITEFELMLGSRDVYTTLETLSRAQKIALMVRQASEANPPVSSKKVAAFAMESLHSFLIPLDIEREESLVSYLARYAQSNEGAYSAELLDTHAALSMLIDYLRPNYLQNRSPEVVNQRRRLRTGLQSVNLHRLQAWQNVAPIAIDALWYLRRAFLDHYRKDIPDLRRTLQSHRACLVLTEEEYREQTGDFLTWLSEVVAGESGFASNRGPQ